MKKLVSLLGSLSLVATSSVAVVACGTDKVDPVDPTTEITKLIEELLRDFELTTDSYWQEKNRNFFDISTNPSTLYSFLKENLIKNYVDENRGAGVTEGAVKGDLLTDNQKSYLSSDIDKILVSDQMKRYYQSNIDQEKYALLIEGIDFYQGFEPDWTTLEVNYTNDSIVEGSQKTDFISYVSLNLNLNFEYLDTAGELTQFNLVKRFIFTLTSNGIMIDAIDNLEKNITNDYYLSGGEYSWIDATNFASIITNEDKAKIFKPFNSDFKSVYEYDQNFRSDIISFMGDTYFKEITGIPLEFTGEIIFDSFKSNDYMSASKNLISMDWATGEGPGLYNSIFSELEHNDKSYLFGELGSTNNVNIAQYKYLQDNYMSFYNAYNTRNKAKLAEIEKAAGKSLDDSKQLAFDNSISNGYIKLKGLSIDISNSSYIHPINDFSIFVSIAVKNDEVKNTREDFGFSHLFGAMYTNLEMGIEAFHKVFDIQKRTDESISNSSIPIVRFSGQGSASSGDLDNIWNGIKPEDNEYTSPINKGLSLTEKSLSKHRQELLDSGRQQNYAWSLHTSGILSRFRTDAEGMNVFKYYYAGDKTLPWNFEQNFINIDFNISNIWTKKNVPIFERTEPSVG